jgi:hypothetical protein
MAVEAMLGRRGALIAGGDLFLEASWVPDHTSPYGGPTPTHRFLDARYVDAGVSVDLWQQGQWMPLSENVTGARPAQPTDMFGYGLWDRASERLREVLYRRPSMPGSPTRPRFARIDPGPHDPTPEERAERLTIGVSVRLRDATEDFPSPIPRGLRVIVAMTVVSIYRTSAHPRRAGQWHSTPELAVETVTPRTAEDRAIALAEAHAARRIDVSPWPQR